MNFVSGGFGRLRERIDLHPLAVRDGLRDVGIAVALEVRAEQRVAADVSGLQRRCSRRGPCSCIVRRQDQELAALALVHAEQARILQRHLPDVDDVGVERPSRPPAARRARSARLLRVEEHHE